MIVLTTPTGQIGRQLLDRLVDRTESVRVIARASRLPAHVRDRVEVVTGSHGDVDVLAKALSGADTVFWLVPPNARADGVEQYYLDFTRALCRAVQRNGVPRVVGVSTLGRGYEKNAGHLSAALEMDRMIEDSGVGYRALRMPFYMENLLHQVPAIRKDGTFSVPNSVDSTLLSVATRDIADAAAALTLDGSWAGQDSVPVIGPDDLTPAGMAAVISDVLRRPVRVEQPPAAEYKASMTQRGMSEPWAQGLLDMAAAQDDGIYDDEARTAPRTTTSFRQWCIDTLKPAVEE